MFFGAVFEAKNRFSVTNMDVNGYFWIPNLRFDQVLVAGGYRI